MNTNSNTRRQGALLAAATATISGFAVFINGYGVRAWSEAAGAVPYTTLKNLTAALLIGVFAWAARMRAARMRGAREKLALPTDRRSRLMLGVIAVVGGGVPFALFFEGLARAGSTEAAFLHKSLVIWVAVLAAVFLKERLSWPHVAAIGLLVWGQTAILGSLGDVSFGAGEAMILAAVLLWSVEVIVAKKALADVSSTTVAAARMIGGSVVLVAWAAVGGSPVEWSLVTGAHWMWIVVTGLFLSGYVLTWFAALSRAAAVDVTAVLVGGAVITALLQSAVRGAVLPNPLGLALLAAGAALAGVISWRAGAPQTR